MNPSLVRVIPRNCAYAAPRRSAWETVYLPLLREANVRALAQESGIVESLLHRYRKGSI